MIDRVKDLKEPYKSDFERLTQCYLAAISAGIQSPQALNSVAQIMFGEDSSHSTTELSQMLKWLEKTQPRLLPNILINKIAKMVPVNEAMMANAFVETVAEKKDTFKRLFDEWQSNTRTEISQKDVLDISFLN